VKKSLENKIMFEYLSKKLFFERRLELLAPLLYYYPADDPFYDNVEKEFNTLEEDYRDYLDNIYDKYPDLIVTRFIRFDQLEDIRPGEVSPQRTQHLKQHYFEGIDLTDTLLLYSPLLPGRIIDYLSLYVAPGSGQEKQEELFMQAIDSLMGFTLPGSKVREVVVNYLIEGFQAYGLENVMTYMVENYVLDQSCVSEQREEILKKRIEGFKKLAIGNFAPDFEAYDIKGELVKLSKLPYEVKILFFWSSDCPHCSDAIPVIKRLATNYKDVAGVIAISVDSEESSWVKAIEDKGMDWINIAELNGWDGEIIKDYHIYATPTILVLDQYLEILAKPSNVRALEAYLVDRANRN
jgi:peroxiredoxin